MKEITLHVKKLSSTPFTYRVGTYLFFYGFERKCDADEFAKSRLNLMSILRNALFEEHRKVFNEIFFGNHVSRENVNSLYLLESVLYFDVDAKSEDFERQLFYCLDWFYSFYSSRGKKSDCLRIANLKELYFFRPIVQSTITRYDVRLTAKGRSLQVLGVL